MNRFLTLVVAGVAVLPMSASHVVCQQDFRNIRCGASKVSAQSDETIDLTRTCRSYINKYGFILPQENAGSVARLVKNADGSYLLENPVSEMKTNPVVCNMGDGTLDFVFPQTVGEVTIEEEGEEVTYNVCVAVFTEMLLEDGYTSWGLDENQEMSFAITDDGAYVQTDPAMMLGMGVDLGEYGIQWLGFGDVNISMSPMTAKTVDVPEGLQAENYVVTSFDSPYIAKVGFDGNDVYIRGLVSAMPEGWVKGAVDGDSIVFDNGQYLGIVHTANIFNNYGYCVAFTSGYDEDWNIVYNDPEPVFAASYDKDARTISFPKEYMIGLGIDPDNVAFIRSYNECVSLEYRGVFEPTTPPDPVVEYFGEYDPETGYGEIDFTMPDLGADGKVLDYDNYYYNLIVDGEIYEVTPEVYPTVANAMTNIPYRYTDENDIYSYPGGYHMFYFRIPEYKTISLQSVYIIDGVENRSGVVLAGTTGVEKIEDNQSPVVEEEYFDLFGRKVKSPSNGIFIRKTRRADGTSCSAKVVME